MDEWRKRYYRAILDHLGGSDEVDLETMTVVTDWTDAGGYSEYTNWDSSIAMHIEWTEPAREPEGFFTGSSEKKEYRWLTNDEVADLIRSFG